MKDRAEEGIKREDLQLFALTGEKTPEFKRIENQIRKQEDSSKESAEE